MRLWFGVDPGFANCGWAVIDLEDGRRLVASGTIYTETYSPLQARITLVIQTLRTMWNCYRPEGIGIEGWEYQGKRSHGPNDAAISSVVAKIEAFAECDNIPHLTLTTRAIKRALGCRTKADIARAMARIGLAGRTGHESDASAAAIVAEQTQRIEKNRSSSNGNRRAINPPPKG